MCLDNYIVPYKSNCNICFDCKKSVGGCSWSEVDQNTKQIRFELPDGCRIEKCKRRVWNGHKIVYADSFKIVYCPLFERG